MRLLIAEDDDLLGGAMQKALTRAGYAVDWVRSGREGNFSISSYHYDLVILDLGLPDVSGESLLARVRSIRAGTPVIIVTARGGVVDRIALLDLGADDYLVKPFDLDELTARIRSVIRRTPAADGNEGAVSHGPLRLFPQRSSATLNGNPITLTPREFSLLETLVRRRNQVLTRAQLEEAIYAWGDEVGSNAIEVYIHFLRRKLGSDLIQTIRGVGYRLAPAGHHA